MAKSNPVKYAVIGIGRMGKEHATNLVSAKVENSVLTAVCDIDSTKLGEFCVAHPTVRQYTDYKQLLADRVADAVIVATPHYSHVDIAIAALEAGCHVMVEKPLSVTVFDAQRLVAVSDAHPSQCFGIMFNQRTNPLYQKAKKLIDTGTIGKLQRVNFIITEWYRTQSYYDQGDWRASWSGEGGGLLINQCVHQLDILTWLVGMPNAMVAVCKTVNRKITVENEATLVMRYDTFHATLTASAHELPGTTRLEIAGTKGSIIVYSDRLEYVVTDKSEEQVNACPPEDKVARSGSVVAARHYTRKLTPKEKKDMRSQHVAVLRAFTSSITRGTSLVADGREGVNSLNLINGAYMSAWLGGTRVKLPVDAAEYVKILTERVNEERRAPEQSLRARLKK